MVTMVINIQILSCWLNNLMLGFSPVIFGLVEAGKSNLDPTILSRRRIRKHKNLEIWKFGNLEIWTIYKAASAVNINTTVKRVEAIIELKSSRNSDSKPTQRK